MALAGQGVGVTVVIIEKIAGTDLPIGLALNVDLLRILLLLRNSLLRLEWQHFYGIEDEDGMDSTSLVVQYSF